MNQTKTRQNEKRKKEQKANKQNKQKATPSIYIVPGVGS
jgi:uncharacterized alpha/beta hydrolase family protein